jgi:hypothetical protein
MPARWCSPASSAATGRRWWWSTPTGCARATRTCRRSTEAGAEVKAGEAIGRAGRSGRATGTHLHFEVTQNGHPIDPHSFSAGGLKVEGVTADWGLQRTHPPRGRFRNEAQARTSAGTCRSEKVVGDDDEDRGESTHTGNRVADARRRERAASPRRTVQPTPAIGSTCPRMPRRPRAGCRRGEGRAGAAGHPGRSRCARPAPSSNRASSGPTPASWPTPSSTT